MRVEFLGHAGILVESGPTRVVMDPWFSEEGAFDASWYQLPANHHLADRVLSGVSAVIVSHEHMDHLDGEFLRKLPAETPLYVTSYASALLVRKVTRLACRPPTVLRAGREHSIGDICLRAWTELSPMNQDSVWVFKHGGRSVVHTVDSRLSNEQLDEILDYVGGSPDLLLVQGSGASWYPLCYDTYTDAEKHSRGLRKREQKLAYALATAKRLGPKVAAINAGPAAFLDPSLVYANRDPSFPTPAESRDWFAAAGYRGRVEAPLPGDAIDLATGRMALDPEMHASFSWDHVPEYIDAYAARMRPFIDRVRQRADDLIVPNMDSAIAAHFTRMAALSPYFNARISMTLCLELVGPEGGRWLIDFGSEPRVRPANDGDSFQYRYRLHSRWMKRILADEVPWEDFLLSLRFSASRDPDVYNDHLLGLLKFNDAPTLRAIEQWERRGSDEEIVVTAQDGARYQISKYCPHAGASMDKAPIEGHTITCLNHHYVFDLDTGRCLTGNCSLKTRRLP